MPLLRLSRELTPFDLEGHTIGVHNIALHIATTAGCFLIFGVFYALVYRITSNAYYSIVSGARENE